MNDAARQLLTAIGQLNSSPAGRALTGCCTPLSTYVGNLSRRPVRLKQGLEAFLQFIDSSTGVLLLLVRTKLFFLV